MTPTTTLPTDLSTGRPVLPRRSIGAALKAALVHATLSFLVAVALALFLKASWYPGAIFEGAGVRDFLIILIGVDVTLGPLITAVAWVPGKPGLVRDMAIIVALQIAGLAYGLHVLADTRPVYWVATQDRLRMVTRAEISPEDASQLQPGWKPQLRAAHLPENAEDRRKLMDSVLSGGPDIDRIPFYWRDYSTGSDLLWSRARPVDKMVLDEDDASRLRWASWWHDVDLSKSRFVPFRVLRSDISAVLHPVTHKPVAFLTQEPWGVQPVNPVNRNVHNQAPPAPAIAAPAPSEMPSAESDSTEPTQER